MIYQIKNQNLTVSIDTKGAQMLSLKGAKGREYLWQGDPATWEDRAPHLFPYVGRLTQESYRYEGKTYAMGIHGFAMHSEFQVTEQEENRIVFEIRDTEKTRASYPFTFTFSVEYKLEKERLFVTYRVKNQGENTMYFGLGGHPGFRVPMEEGLDFSDYYIEFEPDCEPVRIGMSETCYVQGENKKLPLAEKNRLPLSHHMFDDDAIILENMGKGVTLASEKGKAHIRAGFPKMDYLGLWHWPKVSVDYICIEPWSSLPSRQDVVEDLETQENLISLEAGKEYENQWWIALTEGENL